MRRERMYGNKYKWKKNRDRRAEILLFLFLFFSCVRIVKSNRLSSFSFILSVSNYIYIYIFFFCFYRWPRFNSLLIRCCSFHGSFADPNRVFGTCWIVLLFFSLPPSLPPRFFRGNCFLGKRKTVVYFFFTRKFLHSFLADDFCQMFSVHDNWVFPYEF